MVRIAPSLNRIVTAFLAALWLAPAAFAQGADSTEVERLLGELAQPEQQGWQQIEASIMREWSKSGSPAMDLLLQRGQQAMEEGDMEAAIEHLSALTDHAPDFAEGWNARATAFFHAGEYGLSLADIERTLALNPDHFGAITGLGIILEELGYETEALEAYRAVEAIHPHLESVRQGIERLESKVEGERL
ncbi:tetratricopeptide repeat protein [Tropicimonas aquimaris]|uniref:Tetratricopeptide repeat protein n=1 Tax=Tropicimonas aquimaris TaxID=914152 RepID=A0ABW3ING8_9RHOB